MDEEHGFYISMRFERRSKLRGQNRLSPCYVDAPHVDSETARHAGKSLAEIAIDPHQNWITRREEIHHGDFPTSRTRSRPRQDIAIRAMDLPRQLERLAVQRSECWSSMRDHLAPKRGDHRRRQGSRTRQTKID